MKEFAGKNTITHIIMYQEITFVRAFILPRMSTEKSKQSFVPSLMKLLNYQKGFVLDLSVCSSYG